MEGTDYLLTNVAFYWARKRFWPRKNKLSQEKNCLAFVNGLRPIFSNHWCKLDHMLLNLLVHLVNGLIFLLGHTYSAQIILYTLKSKRRRSRLVSLFAQPWKESFAGRSLFAPSLKLIPLMQMCGEHKESGILRHGCFAKIMVSPKLKRNVEVWALFFWNFELTISILNSLLFLMFRKLTFNQLNSCWFRRENVATLWSMFPLFLIVYWEI